MQLLACKVTMAQDPGYGMLKCHKGQGRSGFVLLPQDSKRLGTVNEAILAFFRTACIVSSRVYFQLAFSSFPQPKLALKSQFFPHSLLFQINFATIKKKKKDCKRAETAIQAASKIERWGRDYVTDS